MTRGRYLGFVAAAATLLAAAPLSAIFDTMTWLLQSVVAVALVTGAATLARSLRAPVWAQVPAMMLALLFALTWIFPSGDEVLGILPGPATFGHFGELMSQSADDVRSYGVPVPDGDPLLFISVLGIGGVAVVVDLLTVGLRRPALAGLPMLAIYSVPVAVYSDSVPALPFAIGAVGFLWLLVADNVDRVRRFGRRFTGDGRDVDVWEPSPLAAAGRRLAVVGVALAVLLPVAVPGMSSGLLTNFTTDGGSGPGGNGRPGQGTGPGRVNLFAALSGQLNQSRVYDMVKVTTTEDDPFYLRFGAADEIRRDGFGVRTPRGTPVTRSLPDPREAARPGVSRETHRAEVEITDDFVMPFLPVYGEPVGTRELDANWLYDPDLQVVYSNRQQSRGKKYSFEYVRSRFSPIALRAATPLPAEDETRQRLTQVPAVPEVQTLVDGLIADRSNDYDRVRAIYDYFSRDNGFSYNLRTEGDTSGEDIVNFLDNKVGYCQQYSAAMAWMVRAAGIPARVAFGFTNGSNRTGGTYTLTNLNLHAWTEVYFGGIGWVPFDPTPASSVAGSARSAWAPDTDAPDPVTPSAAPTGSAGPNTPLDPGDENLSGGGLGDNYTDDPTGATPETAPRWPWWTAAGVALVIVLLALPGWRRGQVRRRRHAATVAATPDDTAAAPGVARVVVTGAEAQRARADAHAAWDELIDTLVDYRVPVDPTETPRATADRLVKADLSKPAAADGVRLLGRAEERARYAREPLPGVPLTEALRSVRRALAEGADRRTRLLAATLPPSVLLRWRGAIMDASGRLVATTGRWRDAVTRWSPRRLLAARTSR
ncbi:DUF3488 and transglutaminase-like domain-containing protein [Polymorphospora sp. NPDC051019]|uniref:transglutaminase TgpA family protein n=1 Tax=Polymorphospora sp. NPDC051019 TaxID=3155725 RepID=UPI00343408FB